MLVPYTVLLGTQAQGSSDHLIGQQAANLNELRTLHLPIPPGFIITTHALKVFCHLHHFSDVLAKNKSSFNALHHQEVIQLAHKLNESFLEALYPETMTLDIVKAYNKLGRDPFVELSISLKSQEISELFNSYKIPTKKIVRGDANLLEAIKELWSQIYHPDLITWRHRHDLDEELPAMAILVQVVSQPSVSGILATTDPSQNNNQLVTIEAVWGLSDDLIAGSIDGDHYQVEKRTWRIDAYHLTPQTYQRSLPNPEKRGYVNIFKRNKPKLTNDQIVTLAQVGHQIQQHFYYPQLVYWLVTSKGFSIFRVEQLEQHLEKPLTLSTKSQHQLLGEGWSVSPNVVSGKVRVVSTPKDLIAILPSEIIVTPTLSDNYLEIFKTVKGVVTEHGGELSHSAILARELQIPVVTGVHKITELVKTGDTITLDGTSGQVYTGGYKTASLQPLPEVGAKKSSTDTVKNWVFLESSTQPLALDSPNLDGVVISAKSWLDSNSLSIALVVSSINKDQIRESLIDHLKILGDRMGERTVLYRLLNAVKEVDQRRWLEFEIHCLIKTQANHKNFELVLPYVHSSDELDRLLSAIKPHLPYTQEIHLWSELATPALCMDTSYLVHQSLYGLIVDTQALARSYFGLVQNSHLITEEQFLSKHFLDFLAQILDKLHHQGIRLVLAVPGHLPEPKKFTRHFEMYKLEAIIYDYF